MGITFPDEKLKNKTIDEISSMIKNSDELSNVKGASSLMLIDAPYNELGEISVRKSSSEYLALFYLDVSYKNSTIVDVRIVHSSIQELESIDSDGVNHSVDLITDDIVNNSDVSIKYLVGIADDKGYCHKYKAIYTTINSDEVTTAKTIKLDTSDWNNHYDDDAYYLLSVNSSSQAISYIVSNKGKITPWLLRSTNIASTEIFYRYMIDTQSLSSLKDYNGEIIELTNVEEKISNNILRAAYSLRCINYSIYLSRL